MLLYSYYCLYYNKMQHNKPFWCSLLYNSYRCQQYDEWMESPSLVALPYHQLPISMGKIRIISQFIPRHVLNHLYFVPLPVLVDMFLGTRQAHTHTSKSIPTKYSSLPVWQVMTGPLPITVKLSEPPKSEAWPLLVNSATESSTFQQGYLPGVL